MIIYTICHNHALRHVRLELRRQVWPSLAARNAVASRHAPGWALARSDSAKFRQMTKIATAAMGLRHEPDVPAPDAVPNAMPHALP
jgi:hypothetical protein